MYDLCTDPEIPIDSINIARFVLKIYRSGYKEELSGAWEKHGKPCLSFVEACKDLEKDANFWGFPKS